MQTLPPTEFVPTHFVTAHDGRKAFALDDVDKLYVVPRPNGHILVAQNRAGAMLNVFIGPEAEAEDMLRVITAGVAVAIRRRTGIGHTTTLTRPIWEKVTGPGGEVDWRYMGEEVAGEPPAVAQQQPEPSAAETIYGCKIDLEPVQRIAPKHHTKLDDSARRAILHEYGPDGKGKEIKFEWEEAAEQPQPSEPPAAPTSLPRGGYF